MSVYWITGLSGAGKTTLATALVKILRNNNEGASVIHLDGDQMREWIAPVMSSSQGAGIDHAVSHGGMPAFQRSSRLALAQVYCRVVKGLASQGCIVVVSTISMFEEIFRWNRANLDDYFEIYLDMDIKDLVRQDARGVYSSAGGEVAGLELQVDIPKKG